MIRILCLTSALVLLMSCQQGQDDGGTVSTGTPTDAETAQQACESRGGRFASAGASGAKVCVTRTRDANKVCTASSQCEGVCLARSGTCAPVTPLLGCNDIITSGGGMATVCLD
ncbi:MAG: hypothetical protein QNJ44_23915 [Rhodobacter sp.]|nr:hypothetical protein [Rhodobacter sp.]